MDGRDRAVIGIDVTSALTQGGGIGRYTRELVNALVGEAPEYRYTLFSARPPANPIVHGSLPVGPGITHRPAPVDERWLYRVWYRARLPLPVQMFTGRIDLFHSPDFVLPPFRGRIPTLLTIHDLSFIHYPETFPNNLVAYLNQVVPWSVNRARHILADSRATLDDLVAIWNVPVEKISVLHCGVNDRFRRIRDASALAALRARYDLGAAPFVLSVGTVQPRKNYLMLVRAFQSVALNYPHSLVIAGGPGWLADELETEIERLGMAGRVRLIGFVDDDDLPALYSAADLFLFPSLYEGFGLPLLEAMACGVPVISSNASSLPEVVVADGQPAALLLHPTDEAAWTAAMTHLLDDVEARNTLSEAGQRQAAFFSWRVAGHRLAEIYAQLLAG